MKKLINTVIFLLLGYILPLIADISLIIDIKMIILMIICVFVFLTQPTFHMEEGVSQKQEDKNSVFLILLFSVISVAIPIIEWAYFSDHTTAFSWYTLGLILLLGGVFIRTWAIRTLGKYFTATVKIADDHQLVQHGPYRIVRHPSYLGAYLVFIGNGVLLEAWVGTLAAALIMAYVYHLRISAKEASLVATFGERYESYRLATQKLIPYIW